MAVTSGHQTIATARRPHHRSPGFPHRLVLSAFLACGVSGIGLRDADAATSTAWAATVRSNLAAQGALDPSTEMRFAATPAATPAPAAIHPVTAWARAVESQLAARAHRVADVGRSAIAWSERGMASWYDLHRSGHRTASGARFNPMQLTCAHPTLPLGTKVLVTSDRTGRSVLVTVNDRGPFGGRIVDLSRAAAARIGMLGSGTTSVTLQQATPDVVEVAEAADGDSNAQALAAAR